MNLFLKRAFLWAISLLFIVGGIYKQGKGKFRHVFKAGACCSAQECAREGHHGR